MYYDIHTHQSSTNATAITIESLYKDFSTISAGNFCSIGYHPWYLNGNEPIPEIEKYATAPNVLAIGECGLDKLCLTPWELQVSVFKEQISLASRIFKPLILHCVQAHREVTDLLVEMHPGVPVIFHGYNKKAKIGNELLERGFYLSFGEAIIKDNSPAAGMLALMPRDRFFLETDASSLPIEKIYKKAADIRRTTAEALILQITENFQKVFQK